MTFGEAVRLARRVKGMSQAELARAAGLSAQFVNDIERGRATGTAETMAALARVLKLSLDDIFCVGGYVNTRINHEDDGAASGVE